MTWVWQAGGIASREKSVVLPDDTKGLKIRGGSREFDLMLKEAGGIISSVPSNEIYAAMQTGSLDCRGHVVHQPDLVPARGDQQGGDDRREGQLLVHV